MTISETVLHYPTAFMERQPCWQAFTAVNGKWEDWEKEKVAMVAWIRKA